MIESFSPVDLTEVITAVTLPKAVKTGKDVWIIILIVILGLIGLALLANNLNHRQHNPTKQ